MSLEEELKDFVKSTESSKCRYCGRTFETFNLDGVEMHHLCVCQLIYLLNNKLITYVKEQNVVIADTCKAVRDELAKIDRMPNANKIYLDRRLDIARTYGRDRFGSDSVWQWLFDCSSEGRTIETLKELYKGASQ